MLGQRNREWVGLAMVAGLVVAAGGSIATSAAEVVPLEPTVGAHARPRAEIVDAPDPVYPIHDAGAPFARTHEPSTPFPQAPEAKATSPAAPDNAWEVLAFTSNDEGWGTWILGQASCGLAQIEAILTDGSRVVVYVGFDGSQ